jgi:hypothetical protein
MIDAFVLQKVGIELDNQLVVLREGGKRVAVSQQQTTI